MKSAILLYKINRSLVREVVEPILEEHKISVTNYHFGGEVNYPDYLLMSIKSSQDFNIRSLLPELVEKVKKIIDEGGITVDEKRFRVLSYWLDKPQILGEYQSSDTADRLFPQISVEHSLKDIKDKVEDFKDKIKEFGESLTNIFNI